MIWARSRAWDGTTAERKPLRSPRSTSLSRPGSACRDPFGSVLKTRSPSRSSSTASPRTTEITWPQAAWASSWATADSPMARRPSSSSTTRRVWQSRSSSAWTTSSSTTRVTTGIAARSRSSGCASTSDSEKDMRLDQIPLLKRFMVPERVNGATRIKSSDSERQMLELGSLEPQAALSKLGVTDKGLEPAEVEERLAKFGANEAIHERRLGFLGELFERIKNPLVLQLLVIAVVSYVMGDLRAASVVGGMIVLSVSLAYFQEMRSSKAAEKLQAMIKTTCTALRGGKEVE